MRERGVQAVIIALSGWGREEDRMKTAKAGFDDHLVKPVAPEDLRRLMSKYLAGEPGVPSH
jgi:DNA-binding response OmpR family regulator